MIMARVLAQLWWPFQRRPKVEPRVFPRYRIDLKGLELETAKEILSEVFGTTPGEVEEMIRQRLADQDDINTPF
jgi:hypothetical protein